MSEFWPDDLRLDNVLTPLQMLEVAKGEWVKSSGGLIDLDIQETEEEGYPVYYVHARHVPAERSATLFSVTHRTDVPYPARIIPRDDDIPPHLRKKYYSPGLADFASGAIINASQKGREVVNEWVSDTPAEFKRQLKNVFNDSVVKSIVVALLSKRSSSAGPVQGPDNYVPPGQKSDE